MNLNSIITATAIGCASLTTFADDAATAATAPADSAISEINTLFAESSLSPVLERFSASATVGYESEYVFRGILVAGASVNPAVNIGFDAGYGFSLCAGYWGNYTVGGDSFAEDDFTFGVAYSVESFTVEFDYLAYTYKDGGNTNELKLGVSYDTSDILGDFNVSPYVAGYYDVTLSARTLEGGLSYSAPITKWLMGSNWGTLDMAAYLGYTYGPEDGYAYAGFSFGGSVALTDYCSLSAGMRYAYCNDYDAEGPTNSRLWFGTSISFGF